MNFVFVFFYVLIVFRFFFSLVFPVVYCRVPLFYSVTVVHVCCRNGE